MPPVLSMENITKRYGSTVALDGVSLDVEAGEIHALVGENGSGKSTVCKILFGDPEIAGSGGYQGAVLLNGEPVASASAAESLAYGVALVHQELSLVSQLTVAQNVTLGVEPVTSVLPLAAVDTQSERTIATAALDRLDVELETDALVGELPMGTRQLVELAREFSRTGIKVLVLDEPSAALSKAEAESLRHAMKAAAAGGVAVLFVSHRLGEVLDTADRVSVLRDGRLVFSGDTNTTDAAELARLMIGSDGSSERARTSTVTRTESVRIDDLSVAMPGEPLRGLTLSVLCGEIVGLTSQAGHGRLALGNGLLGFYPATGTVTVAGSHVPLGDLARMERAGLSVMHEDRRGVGLALDESVATNIVLPSFVAGRGFGRLTWLPGGGFLDAASVRSTVDELVERLGIRCSSIDQPVGELSGGNQQKVAIARSVASQPSALVVAEPTRGIDVGAKEAVLDALGQIAEQGVGVVVISGEVAELERICDRIVVLRDGRAAAEFHAPFDPVAVELAVLGEDATGAHA